MIKLLCDFDMGDRCSHPVSYQQSLLVSFNRDANVFLTGSTAKILPLTVTKQFNQIFTIEETDLKIFKKYGSFL